MSSPIIVTGELATVRLRLHEQRLSGDEFQEILGPPGTDAGLRALRRTLETEVATTVGRPLAHERLRARVRWQTGPQRPGALDVSAMLAVDELEREAPALLASLRDAGEHAAVAIRDRISTWLDRPLWAEPERIEIGGGLLDARAAPAGRSAPTVEVAVERSRSRRRLIRAPVRRSRA
jgi:hypothetical protein